MEPELNLRDKPDLARAVDSYLRELRAQLCAHASVPAGADLLDEVYDHVLSHAEHLVCTGAPAEHAVATAVREFGLPAAIGPAMRAELLRPYLHQLATVLLLVGAVVGLGWRIVLDHAPPMPWPVNTRPVALLALDSGAEYTAPAALGLAALGLLLLVAPTHLRSCVRWRPQCQRWAIRASIASATLGVITAMQATAYLAIRGALAPASLIWPAVILAGVLTLATTPAVVRPLFATARLARAH
ncbi:hypothetical protein GCM10023321_59010 [Pseudonocardia eucalypti]|uniref:Uncharacterized protein n=1 Tax=Pseudonocardia eucalypti TaxID=648755 RepID=A0ABP9QTB7_9PSEU|nr:hypothetical protein [Pseudonocardia eucalypti]